MPKNFFLPTIVLLVLVVSIYGIDQGVAALFGEQTLAPLLSILALASLVFFGSSRLIVCATPVLAVESYWLIQHVSQFPLIRALTVALAGVLAWWACRQRLSLESRLLELDLILEKLQTPWILCDRSGTILRLSPLLAGMLQTRIENLLGISLFSRFSAGAAKGKMIQEFLKAADSRLTVEKYLISWAGAPAGASETSLIPIQTREGTGILVLFPPLWAQP